MLNENESYEMFPWQFSENLDNAEVNIKKEITSEGVDNKNS